MSMPKFKEYEMTVGGRVLVNLAAVRLVRPEDEGSRLYFGEGAGLSITATFDTVKQDCAEA